MFRQPHVLPKTEASIEAVRQDPWTYSEAAEAAGVARHAAEALMQEKFARRLIVIGALF